MRFLPKAHRIRIAPVLGLILAAAISACSSSSSGSASTPTTGTSATATAPATAATTAPASSTAGGSTAGGSAAAIAEIKTNWEKFFNSSTPNSERLALLENGSSFSSALSSFSANPLASTVSSKVDSVTLTSATRASVTYDLTAAGAPVASAQKGTSVLQDGTWKVGDDVFCGLLKEGAAALNVKVPAACGS
jgi:hypothetical protein